MELYLSPKGRVGPEDFFKGWMVLTVIYSAITLISFVNYSLSSALGFVSLALIIPMVFLLIKRSHDSGKSGWYALLWLFLVFVISSVFGQVITNLFAADLVKEMQAVVEEAGEAGDIAAVFSISAEFGEKIAQKISLPSAIGNLFIGALTAYCLNLILKQDPNENKWGPVSNIAD